MINPKKHSINIKKILKIKGEFPYNSDKNVKEVIV